MKVIGVLGGWRRDRVTPWGAIDPGDGSTRLDWWVAAEDRWYRPAEEPSLRQHCLAGAPVVETRLRVPGGDVVHRVTAVPDHGGLTMVEVTNESPLPVAVAFTRPDLWLVRPPTEVPHPGAELPTGSVVLPLGHRASVRAALVHDLRPGGYLPSDLVDVETVRRGWVTLCERSGRVTGPDSAVVDAWVEARCQGALTFDADALEEPVAWLLRCHEAVRLGEPAERWLAEVAGAVERLMRPRRRLGRRVASSPSGQVPWDTWRALLAAEAVVAASADDRALTDMRSLLGRVSSVEVPPAISPGEVRHGAWFEHGLVHPAPDGDLHLFPAGLAPAWFGVSLEVHDLAVAFGRRLSFALRWHGERPALLWELTPAAGAATPTVLTGGGLDPGWSSTETSGEALLGIPPGAPFSVSGSSGESASFS